MALGNVLKAQGASYNKTPVGKAPKSNKAYSKKGLTKGTVPASGSKVTIKSNSK